MGKLSNKDKVDIANIYHLKVIRKQLESASEILKKAQDDWCILNSCDGDKTQVKKPPILQTVDANVNVDFALDVLTEMERMFKEG